MTEKESQSKSSMVMILFVFAILLLALVGIWNVARSFLSDRKQNSDYVSDKSKSEAPADSPVKNGNSSNRILDTKLSILNARQNSIEDGLARIESQISENAEGNVPDKTQELSFEEQSKLDKIYYENQLSYLEETLQLESADPDWSNDADRNILETFTATGIPSSVKASCHSTFCEIDIEFSNEARAAEDLQSLMYQHLPWNGSLFVKLEEDGKKGTMYLSREGYELPMLEHQ